MLCLCQYALQVPAISCPLSMFRNHKILDSHPPALSCELKRGENWNPFDFLSPPPTHVIHKFYAYSTSFGILHILSPYYLQEHIKRAKVVYLKLASAAAYCKRPSSSSLPFTMHRRRHDYWATNVILAAALQRSTPIS